MVKHLPTMWETQVRSLGWEDPLEKEMATHSRENPMYGGTWQATVHVVAKSWTQLSDLTHLHIQVWLGDFVQYNENNSGM